MLTFKRVQSVLFALAILGVVSYFAIRFPVHGQDADSTRTKLTSLLKERRDVLKTRVEVIEALLTIAKSPPEAVLAARDELLDAEYSLATSKAQRIDVLKQKLVNAKEYETIIKARKQDAQASEADVLMAKARRLGVEIELLKAQE